MAILGEIRGPSANGLVARAVLVLLATTAAYYLYRGVQVRLMFRRLQKQGLPMIAHSFLFGHLGVVGRLVAAQLPPDAHGDYVLLMLQRNWPALFPGASRCPPVIYLDMWPFTSPLAVVMDGAVVAQYTQETSLVKADNQKAFLYPLTRCRDLAAMEGDEWRLWRRRLGPAFSIASITARIPDLLDEVDVFVAKLEALAGDNGQWGRAFQLEGLTMNLSLDIIGRFLLDRRLDEQSGRRTPLSAALIDTLRRLRFYVHIGNIAGVLNPWRQYKIWRNRRTMDGFLLPLLRDRLEASRTDPHGGSNKTLIDLLVQSIRQESADDKDGGEASFDPHQAFTPDVLEVATGHIKTFLFAGHDTTATTLCWALHLLATHPAALARVRAELTDVLGPETSASTTTTTTTTTTEDDDKKDGGGPAAALRAAPHLVHGLAFTHACVKETLRVYTNVSTMRKGRADFVLREPGAGPGAGPPVFPTDGFVLWDGNWALHRDPAAWARPDEFVPERWMADGEGGGGAGAGAGESVYRPFELGPRNCIGQHLAVVEIKMVLALVLGRLDVEGAWGEWDALLGRKGAPETVFGDRAYQIFLPGTQSTPHVKDGMPVRVRRRV